MPVSFLCPYDERELPPEIVEHAHRTHPEIAGPGGSVASDSYEDPHEFCRRLNTRVEPPDGDPSTVLAFNLADLRAAAPYGGLGSSRLWAVGLARGRACAGGQRDRQQCRGPRQATRHPEDLAGERRVDLRGVRRRGRDQGRPRRPADTAVRIGSGAGGSGWPGCSATQSRSATASAARSRSTRLHPRWSSPARRLGATPSRSQPGWWRRTAPSSGRAPRAASGAPSRPRSGHRARGPIDTAGRPGPRPRPARAP